MHKIKEMLMKELYEYEEKAKKMSGGKISAGDLETIHKLTDTVKNIDKIEMLSEGDYSNATDWMGEGRMYGVSYRNNRRDSRGRYSRDDGHSREHRRMGDGASYRGNRGGYSGEDGYSYNGVEHMMEKAEELMESAENEQQRQAIRRFMQELERI
jgi:hypothetical protein